MTPILFQLLRARRPLGEQIACLFKPAEPLAQDHPFAPTDLAQLLRVHGFDPTAQLDDATWRDLLLERYLDTLGPEVSICGRQVLYRRLRAGTSEASELAARRARVSRLMHDPAQLEALHGKLACLRAADIEVATLLFEDEPPPRPGWVGYLLVAETIPDAAEYANWFLAAEVRHYFHTAGLVFGQRAYLRECFWLCAELEADVALARHLRVRAREGAAWCWADSAGQRTLQLDGGVHPLLAEAGALSISLEGKGAFLSGQNGVGKSTFLRTVGLNLAAARAFGFCYAHRAALPMLPVVASMQNEDSLLGGQSLYVAELARARELLAAASARPSVCLIDEVFRGTNHEKAVSAAAAVVDALAQNALVLVSSHNLVLGPLLAHRPAPWRIVRAADAGDALRMEGGVLGRTNGVALLAEHGFDGGIQRQAKRVAAWLARQRHTEDGAGLLQTLTAAP